VGAGTPGGVAVVVPAKDEAVRVAATVAGARRIPGVDLVVVVDDGSQDDTAQLARQAGAHVAVHRRNRGKAAAMTTGASLVARLEAGEAPTGTPRCLLFLDADLQGTAAAAAPLTEPVLAGAADMTIAVLPAQATAGGGHGFVVRLARDGIRQATGWAATQPLSGQRCLTRPAFQAALPLASGFGVEVGLTIDLLRAGLRVQEVPVAFHHRVTGTDWRAQVHRGRQWLHVARALAARRALPVRGRNGGSTDAAR
jgi:glycosyltransferase involved in cell wall biosynthesis